MAPVSKSQPRKATGDATRSNATAVLDPARQTRRPQTHPDDQIVEGMLFVPVRPGFRGAA